MALPPRVSVHNITPQAVRTADERQVVFVDEPGLPGPVGPTVEVMTFSWTGDLEVTEGPHRLPVIGDGTITGIAATLSTAPTATAAILDVNKNGVSVFATPDDRLTFPPGEELADSGTIATPELVTGDYLTVDIDQIGTMMPGADLVVVVHKLLSD